MTVGGVNPAASSGSIVKTDGSTVSKRLYDANKTVLDAKARAAEEDEYQEFVEDDETTDETSDAKTTGTSDDNSGSVKEKDDRVLRYYEQIDSLRTQLDDINRQRRALVDKMQAGTSASDLQNELTALNNQSSSINSNINLIFATIMQLEQSIESENLANYSTNAASGVSNVAATTGTNAVTSATTGLSDNAKVDTQTGKKLAEAVVSCINTNGSTTGWCLRGVNRAMSKVYGYGFSFGSAYQALGALQSDSNFVEITGQYPNASDLKNLPAGAIVVWGNNSAHPHGHISIALGDGREASDHIANQYTNSGNGYHIFMPKEK